MKPNAQPGDHVVIDGMEYIVEHDSQPAPVDAKHQHCWGCAFYDKSCGHITCTGVIFMKIEDAVTFKLTGKVQ